jgi:hypothetical protein
MKWLTPFAWVDDRNGLHLDCERVLRQVGLPVTAENIEIAASALTDECAQLFPDIPIEVRHIPATKGDPTDAESS